jgi:hypothetical protein
MTRYSLPSGRNASCLFGRSACTRFLALALAVTLAGCNLPNQIDALTSTAGSALETGSPSLTPDAGAVPTASLTAPLPTLTLATLISTRTPTPLPQPTRTLTATAVCNRALPGLPIDISIPDDTIMTPGQVFSKTWRLQNAGSCQWTTGYAVVYFSGDLLGAARVNPFAGLVLPGQTVDITVDMVAPLNAGSYQGNWELRDPDGTLFGLGPDGNAPFWVRIIVVAPSTATATSVATVTPTSAPSVYANGLSNLKPGDTLDLDTNKVNAGANDDLLYTLETDKTHRLTPQNGAHILAFGMTAPSFHDCSKAAQLSDPIALDAVAQGTYFCYTTNIGLPGWARLVALNAQDHTLTLEILTWAIP